MLLEGMEEKDEGLLSKWVLNKLEEFDLFLGFSTKVLRWKSVSSLGALNLEVGKGLWQQSPNQWNVNN